MSQKTDVVIVGGGVVGVSAAYFLARKGTGVLLLEKGEIASGSSYGNAGLVVPSFHSPLPTPEVLFKGLSFLLDKEGPLRIKPRLDLGFMSWMWRFVRSCTRAHYHKAVEAFSRLNREGLIVHKELAALGADEFEFDQRGLLNLFLTEKALAQALKEADGLGRYSIFPRPLSAEEVREFEPACAPEVKGGLYYEEDCSFRPADFVRWLAAQAKEAGATIMTHAEVFGFGTDRGRVRSVRTTRGEFRGDSFILAAGAWQPVLTGLLGKRIPVEGAKGYSLAFPLPRLCPSRPLILEEKHIAVTPYHDFLRLTGILDLTGLNMFLDPKRLDLVPAQAEEYLPSLKGLKAGEVWQGLRPCSPDGLPIMGRLSPWKNLFVAGGHDTKGMSLGPLTGLYLSRLLSGRSLDGMEKILSPDRF